MSRSPLEDQENLPIGVAALITPSRHPLKRVADSRVNNGTPTRLQHSDISTKILFKRKQKSKRRSAPVHNLRQVIPSLVKALVPSPIREECLSEDKENSHGLPSCKDKDVSVEDFVENVVGKIVKEVEKNESKLKTESMPRKMEANESIILQMNKERLRLERQLSELMKEQLRTKKLLNASTATTTINTGALEKELALKTKELCELQQQRDQLQEMLLELPGLKKDLQKSRQETKGVSEVLFSSRKETAQLKDLVAKLNKQIKNNKTVSENYKELQETLEKVTQERDKNISEVERLNKLVEQKDNEVQQNRMHCITLKGLVDRLENASSEAEKFVASSKENETVLQYQIDELSLSLETNSQLLEESRKHCMDRNNELSKSRESEKEMKEQCEKLVGQINYMTAELDIHKMEISRQEDVFNRQQREINDLKVKLATSLEQLEYIQCQQQEMNEFTEEERRNLEFTLSEMENQLKLNKLEKTELDASLRSKSEKYEELVEEVKFSRDLLQDKQEELDATQSQAHWIVLQQEAIIADTAKELSEISDLVNDLLWKFSKESSLEEVDDKEKVTPEVPITRSPGSDVNNKYYVPANSLVQSILEARAMRDNELELRPPETRCDKLSPIPEASEEEQDCSQTSEDEEKPPSLTEQALELKQALRKLAEICGDQASSVQTQNTVKRLEKERILLEEQHKSSLQKVMSQLEDSRLSENSLRREISRKNNQISALQQQLEESRNDLQHSFRKIDSLSEQCEKTIDQQARISELTADLRRFSDQVKTLEREKESLSQQLKESLATLDQLSQDQPDLNKTQDVLGKLLAEKFKLENKVQQLKEKSVAYRLETQDYMTEYKHRTESKIRVLEGNIQKAETEICRLDALVEKIRLILHQYHDVIRSCPDLSKLLSFLDGEDIQ
ncbi:hypothetical protein ACROYT_G009642 [Oculina patagonica]